MSQPKPFVVGRQAEVERFDALLAGRTAYHLLNIYGPGGIGKTIVGQKITAYANSRQAPVAMVDGSRPDLTPDRILYGFMEGLARTPADDAMKKAFRDFDREFRDYLVVNQVLQRGGGIQALFDVVGNIKDPTGLATIIGELGSSTTEAVKSRLNNRFALERYLRGAERTLTSSFVDGLAAGMAAVQQPVTLVIDTYEEMEGLDDWVCRTLMAELPDGVRLIILGRNQLHKVNFDWNEYEEAVYAMPLPELGEAEAKAYLQHFGLTDPVAVDQVYRYTGGYPLLLVLVRHLAREAGGWANVGALESSADRDQIATKLLDRILREEQVKEVQAFLEKGVVARWFDPETIGVILQVDLAEARRIYDKLQRHSFVERHPYGLKFHDKIRELLLDRLKFTSKSEHDRLTQRLMNYYAQKAGIEPAGAEPTQPQSMPAAGPAKYVINIQSGQGIAIGDHAQVHQHLDHSSSAPAEIRLDASKRRCADLAAHIHDALQLIKEYEDQLRLADDPKVKRRAEMAIAELRSQLAGYEKEQRDLGCEEDAA
jgi:hypothetical protein